MKLDKNNAYYMSFDWRGTNSDGVEIEQHNKFFEKSKLGKFIQIKHPDGRQESWKISEMDRSAECSGDMVTAIDLPPRAAAIVDSLKESETQIFYGRAWVSVAKLEAILA